MRSPPPLPGISSNILRVQKRFPNPWRYGLLYPLAKSRAPQPPPKVLPPPPILYQQLSLLCSIKSASAVGRLSDAFTAFSLLRRCTTGRLLLLRSFSFLLRCSTARSALRQGQQLHALILTLGFQDHTLLIPKLVSFYASFCLLSDARCVAASSTRNRSLAWNLLVSEHARCQLWKAAISTYREMVENGITASKYAYSSVLRACGETGDLGLGREIHASMSTAKVELDLCAWNSLLSMYVKCGAVDSARRMFDGMPMKDVITWNTMISGYVSAGMWVEAFDLLPWMQEGPGVNTVTWNAIVAGNLQLENNLEALRLISRMRISGQIMDHVTLINALKACCRVQSVKIGKEIHAVAVRIHCDALENIVNALITMYSRCKNTSYPHILFGFSAIRSVISWNAMIAGISHSGKVDQVYQLFREMIGSGIQPNEVTVIVMLSLCTRVMNLKHGQELHCYVTKWGFEDHLVLGNSLIGIYAKLRSMAVARRLFDMMRVRDVVSYTLLIAGYGMQREGVTSLKLFHEMISSGIEPDHVTMVAILSACSHSVLVNEGLLLFDHMVTVYGIVPRVEHFSCIVDLYCRVGLVKKAEELINYMSVEPSRAMLATVVGACRIHGNTEIGLRAAKKLFEMNNGNPSQQTLADNVSAGHG